MKTIKDFYEKILFSSIIFFLLTLNISTYARTPLKGGDLKSMVNILKVNESLHKNFFEYTPELVEEDARRLEKAISKVRNRELKDLLKGSRHELEKIKAKNDRESNNMAYHKVSLCLIKVLQQFDPGKRYNAYSCPMVKKKWVQNSVKKLRVHNPYAPEMPHCGQRDTEYNEK